MYAILNRENEVVAKISADSKRLPILADEVVQQIGEDTDRGFNRIINSYLSLTTVLKDEIEIIENGYKILHFSEYNSYVKSYVIDSIKKSRENNKPIVTFEALDELVSRCNNKTILTDIEYSGFVSVDVILERLFSSTEVEIEIDDTYYPVSPLDSIKIASGSIQNTLNEILLMYSVEMVSYVKLDKFGNYDSLVIKVSKNLEEDEDVSQEDILYRYKYGENISNITKTINRDFATRFYVMGGVVEGTEVNVDISSVTPDGENYLDFEEHNDKYNNGATKIETLLTNDSILEPVALKAWAINEIESKNLHTPTIKYEIDLVLDELPNLGQRVLVRDDELEVSIIGKVIERTLSESDTSMNSIKIGNFKEVKLKTIDNILKKELDKLKNEIKNDLENSKFLKEATCGLISHYNCFPELEINFNDDEGNYTEYYREAIEKVYRYSRDLIKTDYPSISTDILTSRARFPKDTFKFNLKSINMNDDLFFKFNQSHKLARYNININYIKEFDMRFKTEIALNVDIDITDLLDINNKLKKIRFGLKPCGYKSDILDKYISKFIINGTVFLDKDRKMITGQEYISDSIDLLTSNKVIIELDTNKLTSDEYATLLTNIIQYDGDQNIGIDLNVYTDDLVFRSKRIDISLGISDIDFKINTINNDSILIRNNRFYTDSNYITNLPDKYYIVDTIYDNLVSYGFIYKLPKRYLDSLTAKTSNYEIDSKLSPIDTQVKDLEARIAQLEALIKGGG